LITDSSRVYRSTDQGANWVEIHGLPSPINRIDTTSDGSLYASTIYWGLFRSTDKGLSWNRLKLDYYQRYVPNQYLADSYHSLCMTTKGTLLFSSAEHETFRSTDLGASWNRNDTVNDFNHGTYELLPTPDGMVYRLNKIVFDDSLYRSTDDGISWTTFPMPQIVNSDASSKSLLLDHNNDLFLRDEGLWSYSKDSNNWLPVVVYDTVRPVDMAFDSAGTTEIMSFDNSQNYDFLYKYDPRHLTLQPYQFDGVDVGIETDRAGDIFIYSGDQYQSSPGYVIRLRKGFTKWDSLRSQSFFNYGVVGLMIDHDQYLIAATFGGGFFRSSIPVENGVHQNSMPFDKIAIWCSPIPCANSITLHTNTQVGERGRFEILNMEGSVMRSYKINSGQNETELDLHELPAGSYIGRLMDGNQSIGFTKLLVIR